MISSGSFVRSLRVITFAVLVGTSPGLLLPNVALAAPQKAGAAAAPAASGDLVTRGRTLFDDQKYEESIQVLSGALVRPGNDRDTQIEIYRLLAFNYITLGRKDEAESAIRGLLVVDPTYALPKKESPRFRDVFTAVRAAWEAEGRPGLPTDAPTPTPISLHHTPRSEVEAGTLLPVTIRIEDDGERVKEVRVYYRTGATGSFQELTAELRGKTARALVPGPAVQPPSIDYFVTALDAEGKPVATRGDETGPLRVVVPEASKGWVLPVAIGGGVLAIGALFGGLALAGVFKKSPPGAPSPPSRDAVVSVTIRE